MDIVEIWVKIQGNNTLRITPCVNATGMWSNAKIHPNFKEISNF